MKEPNMIDDLFKDAFNSFSVAPEASVKSAIDASLFKKSGKRRFGFWIFFVGTTIGIISVIAGIHYSRSFNSWNHVYSTKPKNRLAENYDHSRKVEDSTIHAALLTSELEKPNKTVKNGKETESKIISNAITSQKSEKNKGNLKNNIIARKTKSKSEISLNDDLFSDNKNHQLNVGLLKPMQITPFKDNRVGQLAITPSIPDSILIGGEEKKTNRNAVQSLTAFVNYGFESTNSNRIQQNYDLLENGRIQLRSAGIKLEYKRSISNSFAVNASLGYGYHSVLQKGRMTIWDSIINTASITTLSPDMIYFSTNNNGNTNYRYQQFQLGIGFSYTRLLYQNWNLDLSIGSNFSVGQLKQLTQNSIFEKPQFTPLGIALYFRPAIEYKFGKYSILAFGQVSQTVVSQIRWSFLNTRNPSFGGGIGCRYYF